MLVMYAVSAVCIFVITIVDVYSCIYVCSYNYESIDQSSIVL